jgi:hypothetical protein
MRVPLFKESSDLWNSTHGASSPENIVITDWQIPDGNSFAHKEYNQNISLFIDGVQATERKI